MFVGLHHHFLVNVITMYLLLKKKERKINPATYSMMYVCKYEPFLSQRSFERTESLVISFFWTPLVHNGVAYAVLHVTGGNVWYYLHFLLPIQGITEKVLKDIQNGMKM